MKKISGSTVAVLVYSYLIYIFVTDMTKYERDNVINQISLFRDMNKGSTNLRTIINNTEIPIVPQERPYDVHERLALTSGNTYLKNNHPLPLLLEEHEDARDEVSGMGSDIVGLVDGFIQTADDLLGYATTRAQKIVETGELVSCDKIDNMLAKANRLYRMAIDYVHVSDEFSGDVKKDIVANALYKQSMVFSVGLYDQRIIRS